MELETLLENLYEEYSLFHSGSIRQFIEGKDFKIKYYLELTLRNLLYEINISKYNNKMIEKYILILTEEDKETLIKVLKSEEEL
jgi:hypothetical protein